MNTFSQTTRVRGRGGVKHNKKPALAEPFCFLEQHNWQRFYIIIFFKTLKKYCFEPDWGVRSPVACQQFHSKDVKDQIILKICGTKFCFLFFSGTKILVS